MLVEIYQEETIAETGLVQPDLFEGWERRLRLIQELGLFGQERYMGALEKAKEIPFKLLNPEEIRIWRQYLPSSYTGSPARDARERLGFREHVYRRRLLEGDYVVDYAEDLIPLEVLEIWRRCQQMGYFDSYEIWSAREEADPLLLGRIGPLLFLIARWGECLKPFEEIRQAVQSEGGSLRRRNGRFD
ncbi:MAG: hypothetical protein AB1515_07700 [Nitrospirota bacterium]